MYKRTVQRFGQVRIPKALTSSFGALVTLTLTDGGVIVAPFRAGDEGRSDCKVVSFSKNRFGLPIKYRRAVGIGEAVELRPLPDGSVCIQPCSQEEKICCTNVHKKDRL